MHCALGFKGAFKLKGLPGYPKRRLIGTKIYGLVACKFRNYLAAEATMLCIGTELIPLTSMMYARSYTSVSMGPEFSLSLT